MSRFSITVPVGHWHPLLETCLASLAAQSVDLDVALLDASGDPRVRKAAERYAGLLTYRHHGPDGGQADAIAKGWQNTSGDILGWLNADDVLAPGALGKTAGAFAANLSADIVYGHSEICDDAGFVTGYHWNVRPTADDILSTCSISQPSCFFRRTALEAIGGINHDLHYTMDWDLWIRFHLAGHAFAFIDSPLSLVLWSTEAKTGGFGKGRRRELRRLLDMNADRNSRRAGYLGFITHHLYEYVLPRPVRNWVWRRNISGGAGLFGWSVSGEIPERADITLFHYDADSKPCLLLRTTEMPGALTVTVDGQTAAFDALLPDGLRYRLAQAIPPAHTALIALERADSTAPCVSGIRLAGEHANHAAPLLANGS